MSSPTTRRPSRSDCWLASKVRCHSLSRGKAIDSFSNRSASSRPSSVKLQSSHRLSRQAASVGSGLNGRTGSYADVPVLSMTCRPACRASPSMSTYASANCAMRFDAGRRCTRRSRPRPGGRPRPWRSASPHPRGPTSGRPNPSPCRRPGSWRSCYARPRSFVSRKYQSRLAPSGFRGGPTEQWIAFPACRTPSPDASRGRSLRRFPCPAPSRTARSDTPWHPLSG